ncbi:MAG: 2-phosphosulfolactate phosphatase, partial [Rhodothermales bacterium]|nr:2-phosphosulfolactate phosphatase [Rhodothermales bacterium]
TANSASEDDLKGKAVLVIDVLRASSTIVTALNHGARAVIPVADMAEAGKMAAHMDTDTSIMGGERGGTKIEGYALGNSPQEYAPEQVQGRTVVLNTTNGTRSVRQAKGAARVAVASFLNVSQAIAFAYEAEEDVVLLCAGTENRVALEDTLCAGLILHQLWDGAEPKERTDAAHIAFWQYVHDRDALEEAILRSNHAEHLIALGFEEDVHYCMRVDAVPVLPVYRDARLVLADKGAAAYPAKATASEPAEG